MNRIDRLSAILILLQGRRLLRAQDVAERFGISLRTVYRDIRALEEAGVPVIGEAGTGYRLLEGYRLPPVHFDGPEAAALLTAGKLLGLQADESLSRPYRSALDKIRAVLRVSEKDLLEHVESSVAALRHPALKGSPSEGGQLAPILAAIGSGRALELTYRSAKEEVLQRLVEPVGVYFLNPSWHLVAFCRLRQDYRNFRTDRIEDIRVGEEKVAVGHPPLAHFLEKLVQERPVQPVTIEAPPGVVDSFGIQKYYHGFLRSERLGAVERSTFLAASFDGFARWLLLFGDAVTRVEPEALRQEVIALAAKVSGAMAAAAPGST